MRRQHLWLIAVVVLVVVATVSLVACGSSATTTTVGPTTTAGGATTTAGVTTTAAGGTVDAAALYAQDCAGCHKNVPGGSADDIKAIIEAGKGDMPGFKDKLTAAQITALATWVANGGK